MLSDNQKKLVDSGYFNNKIIDYRHYYDPVGHVPFGSIIGRQFIAKNSSMNIPIWGHLRGTFFAMFNKRGDILIDTTIGIKGKMDQSELTMAKNMKNLNKLRKKWQGRGVISPSQLIFSDQAEALFTLSAASETITTCLEPVISECQQAIQAARQHWSKTLRKAHGIAESLNEQEILSALDAGGASKSIILDKPVALFEEKMAQAYEVMTAHDATIPQLKAGIAKIAQFDTEIANEMASLPI